MTEQGSSCAAQVGSDVDRDTPRPPLPPSSPVPFTRRIELLSNLYVPIACSAARPVQARPRPGGPRFNDDILRRILSYCPTPTLGRCLTVSRGLLQIAAWFLYETLDFRVEQLFGGPDGDNNPRLRQTVGWDDEETGQTKRALMRQVRVLYTPAVHTYHRVDNWYSCSTLFPHCNVLHILDFRGSAGCDQDHCRFFDGLKVESLVIHVPDSQEAIFNPNLLTAASVPYRCGHRPLPHIDCDNLVVLVRAPCPASFRHSKSSPIVAAGMQRARETHLVFLRASPTISWQGIDSSEAARNQVPTPDQLKSLILSFLMICRPANLKVVNLEAFDHTPDPESEDGEQLQGPVAVMVVQSMKEELETRHRKAIQESGPEAHLAWIKTPITYITLDEYKATIPFGILPQG